MKPVNMDINPEQKTVENEYLPLLVLLAFLLGLYALLRYGGYWGETDTGTYARLVQGVMDEGRLAPASGAYPNGYGYQSLVVILAALTGLPLGALQIGGGMLLAVWVVIPAWLAFRELVRSNLTASLATLILIVQPEFLFPILRGSHEKFTRGLMFICLFLLLRSLRSHSMRLTAGLVVCFYLCAYALISFNTFIATSFILAIVLALGLVWLTSNRVGKAEQSGSRLIPRLLYVTASLLVIAFIFTFYTYAPAQQQLRILQSMWDRLALLFLQVEDTATNPYLVVNAGWINLPVYFLVSIANWILLGVSVVLWLRQSYFWLVQRRIQLTQSEIMLWAFFTAFALMSFTSILMDLSGGIAGNLQHRIFPSFAMLAAPFVAVWLASQLSSRSWLARRRGRYALGLIFGGLLLLSVFKATNEPLLSNYWTFYTPAELQSISWAEKGLAERSLWVGLNDRISSGYSIRNAGRPSSVTLDPIQLDPQTDNYLLSPAILLQSQRIGILLPVPLDGLLAYDNGEAQIYHRRPETPFQK